MEGQVLLSLSSTDLLENSQVPKNWAPGAMVARASDFKCYLTLAAEKRLILDFANFDLPGML